MKLARACDDSDLIADLLQTLADEGLQSDERFTESFVHQRVAKGHGPLKIRQELEQRGIDDALIEQYMSAGTTDWLDIAERVRARKFGSNIPGDFQNKARQSRFLYNRGFSAEQINQLLKSPGSQ